MYIRLTGVAHEQLLFFMSIATVTIRAASTEICPPEFTTENGTDVIAGNNITLDGLLDDMACKDGSQDMYLTVHNEKSSGIIHVTIPVNSSGWLDINCNISCLNSEHVTLYNFVVLSESNTNVTIKTTVSIPPTTASQSSSTTPKRSQPPSVTSPTTSGMYKL